jgi:hypothetical protein
MLGSVFHWLAQAVAVGCLLISMAACERDDQQASDASTPKPSTEPTEGTLFGTSVSSYVVLSRDVVTKVGVRIPLTAIQAAPADAPFQNDLVLDMPEAAIQQTFLSQLRVNWLAHGHGPAPYGGPHFDFHFYRGSGSEIDAIVCGAEAEFPPEILTADHQSPSSCVAGMGYHAWPSADALPGTAFSASLILGYVPTKLVFIEPMITQATLLEKRDFELAITSPRKSGGASTRYPTLVRGRYEPDSASYQLEFDTFVELD